MLACCCYLLLDTELYGEVIDSTDADSANVKPAYDDPFSNRW
jgi:hypothetical protein